MRLHAVIAASVAFAVSSAATTAKSVYFMATTSEVSPKYFDKFWTVDVASKNLTNLPLKNQTAFRPGYSYDFLSGATVCGDKYLALWTDIESATAGLASIDLTADKDGLHFYRSKAIDDGGPTSPGDGTIYHAIFCDEAVNPPRVLAVRSNPGDVNAQFSVRQISLDGPGELLKDTELARFPSTDEYGGNDAIFSFKPTSGAIEVWAAFPVTEKREKSGVLQVVRLTEPSSQTNTPFPKTSGFPYVLLPDDGSGVAHVATHHGTEPGDCCTNVKLEWSTIEFSSSGEITLKTDPSVDAKTSLWDHSQPIVRCGGLLWSVPHSVEGQIYGSEPATLRVMEMFDISPALSDSFPYRAGGLACL